MYRVYAQVSSQSRIVTAKNAAVAIQSAVVELFATPWFRPAPTSAGPASVSSASITTSPSPMPSGRR